MNRSWKTIASLALVLALIAGTTFAQVSFQVTINVSSGTPSQALVLGVNPGNTIGVDIDAGLGVYQEAAAPPLPPTTPFDARFVTIPGRSTTYPIGLGTGTLKDFRGYLSSTQVDSFLIKVTGDNLAASPVVLSWPATLGNNATSWTIKTLGSTALASTNMIGSTGATVPSDGFTTTLQFLIIKIGATAPTPGPTFVLDKTSLNFGTIGVGVSSSQSVKVSNTGSSNTLSISGITLPADYAISPNTFPATVAPGTDKTFSVTFTPSSAGVKSGNVVFTHNANGGTTNLAVTGEGLSQLGTLNFLRSSRNIPDNTVGFLDTIGLTISGRPLKNIQFTLKTDGQVIFRSIRLTVPSAQWSLAYNIFRGPQNAFGATDDTVNVLLYANGAATLPAGTYASLFTFVYDVVNITNPQETSRFRFANVLGALDNGDPAGVNAGGNETITVKNRTSKGDINLDDRVDILDLLLIVDHITGKSTLTGAAFTAADLYPYPAGDGAVNVQDLSVLQNIILTGQYPDGTRLLKAAPPVLASASGLGKLGVGTDARVTLHVTKLGIAVRLENGVPVKGMQLVFGNVHAVPEDMKLSSALGEAFYGHTSDELTVLLYSRKGDLVGLGDRTVAVLPFSISDPEAVTVSGVVVASEANTVLVKTQTVLSHEPIQELPTSYALEQNYPNPFNPTTDIRFSVPQTGNVKITIYDLLGQQVRTLVSGQMEQGTQIVRWDGKDSRGNSLSSGTYIYRMDAGTFVQTRKMVLLK